MKDKLGCWRGRNREAREGSSVLHAASRCLPPAPRFLEGAVVFPRLELASTDIQAGVRVLAAAGKRVRDLGRCQLRLRRSFVALLLEAVILLVPDQLVVALEYEVALLARVVDVYGLLFISLERGVRLVFVDLALLLTSVLFEAKCERERKAHE